MASAISRMRKARCIQWSLWWEGETLRRHFRRSCFHHDVQPSDSDTYRRSR
jgi:hypothetical protein